ncbi:MAG: hypothetical protein O3B43_05825 [Chloroflexi bacterium]|nr:hypothetical protein [Chloroflexota bacterium]
MAVAKAEGQLELASGYSNLYGDAVGAYAAPHDVPKTIDWNVATWRNTAVVRQNVSEPLAARERRREVVDQLIPECDIDKDPTTELRPNQKDSDLLSSYETLERIREDNLEGGDSPAGDEVVGSNSLDVGQASSELIAKVVVMVVRGEFKRRQYPRGENRHPRL